MLGAYFVMQGYLQGALRHREATSVTGTIHQAAPSPVKETARFPASQSNAAKADDHASVQRAQLNFLAMQRSSGAGADEGRGFLRVTSTWDPPQMAALSAPCCFMPVSLGGYGARVTAFDGVAASSTFAAPRSADFSIRDDGPKRVLASPPKPAPVSGNVVARPKNKSTEKVLADHSARKQRAHDTAPSKATACSRNTHKECIERSRRDASKTGRENRHARASSRQPSLAQTKSQTEQFQQVTAISAPEKPAMTAEGSWSPGAKKR
jgi:hypothetical protein